MMTLGREIVGLWCGRYGLMSQDVCSQLRSQLENKQHGSFSLSPHLQPKRSLSHYFSLSTSIVYLSLKLGFSKTFSFQLILDFLKIAKIIQRIPTYPVSPSVYIFPNIQRSNPGNQYQFNTINVTTDLTQISPMFPSILFLFRDPTLHLVVVSPQSPPVWTSPDRTSAFPCPQ